MAKLHRGRCKQCRRRYRGRGLVFCGNHCRVTWTNLHRNVAKRPDVRAKIAAIAKASGRQQQLMTSEARAKAAIGISKANRGRVLSVAHKRAIGIGCKRAGCTPPRNTHLIGPRHPFWKGGTSPARNADFHNPKYKAFRAAVLGRDNWACRKCGKRGGKLHAHHVRSWAEHPDLRYDPSNGITLCHPCHHSEHRGQRRPKGVGPRTLAELRLSQIAAA